MYNGNREINVTAGYQPGKRDYKTSLCVKKDRKGLRLYAALK